MPRRPLHPCNIPGCGALTRERFCLPHKQEHQRRQDARRGTRQARGYDEAWLRLRRRVLLEEVVCRSGCGRPATEVDHQLPLSRGGTHDRANLQALCRSCHSRKTAREDGAFGRATA